MPGQAYKHKSAFSGGELPGVDNRTPAKRDDEMERAIFHGMMPKLNFLPRHLSLGDGPEDKLSALPFWLRRMMMGG